MVWMMKASTFYSQSMTNPYTKKPYDSLDPLFQILDPLLGKASVSVAQKYASGCGKGNEELVVRMSVTH